MLTDTHWLTTEEAAAYCRLTAKGLHAAMTIHYSHVGLDEKRRAVAPVAKLFGGD